MVITWVSHTQGPWFNPRQRQPNCFKKDNIFANILPCQHTVCMCLGTPHRIHIQPDGPHVVIVVSLREPHTSEKCGDINHAQKSMTKIGLLTCAKRVHHHRLQCILIWLVLWSMPWYVHSIDYSTTLNGWCYHPCHDMWTVKAFSPNNFINWKLIKCVLLLCACKPTFSNPVTSLTFIYKCPEGLFQKLV